MADFATKISQAATDDPVGTRNDMIQIKDVAWHLTTIGFNIQVAGIAASFSGVAVLVALLFGLKQP